MGHSSGRGGSGGDAQLGIQQRRSPGQSRSDTAYRQSATHGTTLLDRGKTSAADASMSEVVDVGEGACRGTGE